MSIILIFLVSLLPGILLMNSVRVLTDEGHIFEFVRYWFPEPNYDDEGVPFYSTDKSIDRFNLGKFRRLREKLSRPMYACEYCTASIWGSVSFFIFGYSVSDLPIWIWPVYCVCLIGLRFELFSFSKFIEVTVKHEA